MRKLCKIANFPAVVFCLSFFVLIVLLCECNLSWDAGGGSDSSEDGYLEVYEGEGDGCLPFEICNGVDDDCDGEVDEDFDCVQWSIVECTTSCGSRGSWFCSDECRMPSSEECPPPAEECNSIDDDCDTVVDNGFSCVKGDVQECVTTCGVGTKICGDDCRWEDCHGDSGQCDPGQVRDCSMELSCGVGVKVCGEDCYWGDCQREISEEICNGRDDDCDTMIDEGLMEVISGDIRLTYTDRASSLPFIAWTGSNYFIFWTEGDYVPEPASSDREIYAAIVSGDGVVGRSDILVTSSPGDRFGAVPVVSSMDVALFWSDYRSGNDYDIYMCKFNFAGYKEGADLRLVGSAGDSIYAGAVWDGSGYAVAWVDDRDGNDAEIYFQLFSSVGSALTSSVRITDNDFEDQFPLQPIWTGSEYLVVFNTERGGDSRCMIAVVSADGSIANPPRPVVDEEAHFCIAGYDDVDQLIGLGWMTGAMRGSSNLRFVLLDSELNITGEPITVYGEATLTQYPTVHYNAEKRLFYITWVEQNGWDTGGECFFAEVNYDGQIVTQPMVVSSSEGHVWSVCSSRWNGRRYVVTWQDDRDLSGSLEVYLSVLGCR